VFLCVEPLAKEFPSFGHFIVPLVELLGIQKTSSAPMNLDATLFHFGNSLGFGCVGVRLQIFTDLFSPVGKSCLKFLLLLLS